MCRNHLISNVPTKCTATLYCWAGGQPGSEIPQNYAFLILTDIGTTHEYRWQTYRAGRWARILGMFVDVWFLDFGKTIGGRYKEAEAASAAATTNHKFSSAGHKVDGRDDDVNILSVCVCVFECPVRRGQRTIAMQRDFP